MSLPSSLSRAQHVTTSLERATYMEVYGDEDALSSSVRGSSHVPSHSVSSWADDSLPAQHPVKSELTESPDFRTLRPSTVLPRPPLHPSTSPKVAIPAQNNTRNISNSQDVPPFVNSSANYLTSPATRTDAFSHYLGPSVSSSSPPFPHVLTHRRQRPRTSNQVFTSSHGSVAPHGLPQNLPPAPSTAPRRTQPEPEPPFPDFASLSSNYINMLSQKTSDNTMAADSTPVSTVAPADLQDLAPGDLQVIVEAFAASSASMPPPTPETPDLWTSPIFSDYGDFSFSSPDVDPLNTPLIADGDEMLTGMFDDSDMGALFPSMDEYNYGYEKPVLPAPLPDNLYTFTPESPALHDFSPSINPSSIYPSPRLPSDRSSFPSPAPFTASALPKTTKSVETDLPPRRRSSATGTRKGVTPEALVSVDAPTQPRKYITPSATSRKEVPSVFAKKRARSAAFGDDDEDCEQPGPNATEAEMIEYKRRQNTVAARRSRKRKLEYQQGLEDKVESLTRERDVWKTRAIMCQDMLIANGVQFAPFEDSIED